MPKEGTMADRYGSQDTRCFHLTFVPDQSLSGTSNEMVQDGDEDEDYFAYFEDLEFTEEDLARIDRTCEGDFCAPVLEPDLLLPKSKDEARVTIEVEQESQPVVSPPTLPRSPMPEPPYYAFRSGKSLSVSDLTGPLWYVELPSPIHALTDVL